MSQEKLAKIENSHVLTQAIAWLAAVSAHRRSQGAYGKVSIDVHDVPGKPQEIHLIEETSFRETKPLDPLDTALAWVKAQKKEHARNGATGKFLIESTEKNGIVTWARVIETTIINSEP